MRLFAHFVKKATNKFFKFIDNLNPLSFFVSNVGAITLLTVLLRIPDVEQYLHKRLSLKILANVLYFLLISLIISIPLIFVLKIRRLIIKLLKKAYALIDGIQDRIQKTLIVITAHFLTPVINHTLTSRVSDKGECMTILSCNEIPQSIYPKNFNLNREAEIQFRILPLKEGDWKIGFKLSKNGRFSPKLHSKNHPIVFISKGEDPPKILANYFDENGLHTIEDSIIYSHYPKAKEIELAYREKGRVMEFEVLINRNSRHKTHLPIEYKYAQLMAWTDGLAHIPHFKLKVVRKK